MDRWVITNLVVQLSFSGAVWLFFGSKALVYLFLSFIFSVGPHPLGGRWVQEHYLTLNENQETYSYYGMLNKLAFNVGYHNEHHDFPAVPWNRLPLIKETAPELYYSLDYHASWTKLFLRFLFDREITLFYRMLRKNG